MFSIFGSKNKEVAEAKKKVEAEAKKKAEAEAKKKAEAEAKKKAEAEAKKKAEAEAKKKAEAEAKKKAEAEAKKKAETETKKITSEINYFVKLINSKEGNNIEESVSIESSGAILSDLLKEDAYLNCSFENNIGFIVLGSGRFKSTNIFESILPYAMNGVPVIFVLNNSVSSDKEINDKLKKFKDFDNVSIIKTQKSISSSIKLKIASRMLKANYFCLLTLNNTINPRSFENVAKQLIEDNKDKDLFVYSHDKTNIEFLRNNLKNSYCIYDSSGWIFNRHKFIEKINKSLLNQNSWLPGLILDLYNDSDICIHDEYLTSKPIITSISPRDIGCLYLETKFLLEEYEYEKNKVESLLLRLRKSIFDIYLNSDINDLKTVFLATVCVYTLYQCELNKVDIDFEYWKDYFDKIFFFDASLKSKNFQNIYEELVKKLIVKENNKIFIIENIGMTDIYNSKFFQLVSEKYDVDYMIKRSNFDYYYFNNMLIKMHSQAATLTIGSGSLNKNMLSENDNHLTLWHGLGWMKKTVVKPEKFTVGTIISSSEYCAPRYKEHFFASEAYGLGSVQTDYLFDKDFRNTSRQKIKDFYKLDNDTKVLFFAPTFRLSPDGQYYDFVMDIEELSKALQEKNVVLITKRHHVFNSIMADKGVDRSGVHTSENGYFIVDENFSFPELICSADYFCTDYSSGMYYAFAIDLPVFLYATDYKEYAAGANGFEINYPDDVPVPFVDTPNIELFIEAMFESEKNVKSLGYQQYKFNNVGACNGNVGQRICEFITKKFFNNKY